MSQSIEQIRQLLKTQAAEKKAQAEKNAINKKNQARLEAAERKEFLLKEANRKVKNAAFETIYTVFNNMIFAVHPDEQLEPILYSAYQIIPPDKQAAYDRALADYQRRLAAYQRDYRNLHNSRNSQVAALLTHVRSLAPLMRLPAVWESFRRSGKLDVLHRAFGVGRIRPIDPPPQPRPPRNPFDFSGMAKYTEALAKYTAAMPIIAMVAVPVSLINNFSVSLKNLVQPKPPVLPDVETQHPAVADILVNLEDGSSPKGSIYWARWASPFRILSADLATKKINILAERDEPITSLVLSEEIPESTAANVPSYKYLFWMEGNREIWKARIKEGKLSAINKVLDIIAPDKGGLWQMEIDHHHQKIYWTNDISIWRANFDGTDNQMVISPGESPFPIDLVIDGENGYLYWIDKDLKMIRRSDLNGILIEDLYEVDMPTKGLKVDPVSQILYWSDQREDGHRLMRGDTQDRAILLNGKNEYIRLGSIDIGTDFTVEMVINPLKQNRRDAFLVKNDNAGGNILWIGHWDGRILLVTPSGARTWLGTAMKGYQHLTFSFTTEGMAPNKTRVSCYRNGELLSTQVLDEHFQNKAGKFWNFGMDWDNTRKTDFFLGSIRYLVIWNGGKSQSDILNGLQTGIRRDHDDLLAYWNMANQEGAVIEEISGRANFALIRTQDYYQPTLSLTTDKASVSFPALKEDFSQGICCSFWLRRYKSGDFGDILFIQNEEQGYRLSLSINNQLEWLIKSEKKGGNNRWTKKEKKLTVKALGPWMHITLNVSPEGKGELFQNAKKLGSEFDLHAYPEGFYPEDILMGYHGGNHLGCVMAEFRIWQQSRPSVLLRKDMHHRFTDKPDNLVGYWKLGDGKGVQLASQISIQHHGHFLVGENDPAKKLLREIKQLRKELQEEEDILAQTLPTLSTSHNLDGNIVKTPQKNPEHSKQLEKVRKLRKRMEGYREKLTALRNSPQATANWISDILPITAVVHAEKTSEEMEEVLAVPGLESMALIYRKEVALIQRKKAYEKLSQAQSEARRQVENEKEKSDKKIQEAQQTRDDKIAKERQKKEKALAQSKQNKADIRAARDQAKKKADEDVEQAKAARDSKISRAKSDAKTTRNNASSKASKIRTSAQTKKDDAQKKYDEAKRRKG